MKTRWCKRCEQTLPLSAFNRYKDGHQWWCRECFREYFKKRGDLHRTQSRAAKRARKQRAQAYIVDALRSNACTDCGDADLFVLEFDHVGRKAHCIAHMVDEGFPLEAIAAEIAGCEVVCCNCHRRRTYRRHGTDRSVISTRSIRHPRVRRNVAWVYELLADVECQDCGIFDPMVLEFDHVDGKRMNVMKMAWGEYALKTIRAEVAKCEVRCANCHRRRTISRGRHFRASAARGAAASGH
ncbi:MAG TPA: hypothetical protein VFK32_06180 [Tepidiformaceae bacterium]|nr:hypothetical protein [Tepidiformaceae bacterium]